MGKVHIYTGEGKGKTTAAIGLALRALGWGRKVVIIQFMKGTVSGEIMALKKLEKLGFPIEVYSYGSGQFILEKPSKRDFEEAEKALKRALKVLEEKPFMLILDEVLVALNYGLVELKDIINLIENAKRKCVELILTGRGAPRELVELADLVTHMVNVKHYYMEGLKARMGIEF